MNFCYIIFGNDIANTDVDLKIICAKTGIDRLRTAERISTLAVQAATLAGNGKRDPAAVNRLLRVLQLFKDNKLTVERLAFLLWEEVSSYKANPQNDEVVQHPFSVENILRALWVHLKNVNDGYYVSTKLRLGVPGLAANLEKESSEFKANEDVCEGIDMGRLSKL